MSILKQTLAKKIEAWRPRTVKLIKEHADLEIGKVTIGQAIGGMRGVKCLVTDISYLDPFEGIRFRGYTIPEVLEKLPKPPGAEIPYVEGFLYLLITGDIPTKKEVKEVPKDHDITDEMAAYKLANDPFPGYFGIFYKNAKPTKNAKEAGINKAAMEKVAGLKDWQILQKTFDRLK